MGTDFYGPGDKYTINTEKPVTVTTQFLTNDGTDDGTIYKVKQFYTQNGKTFEHPMYHLNGKPHKTISDDMCADWVAETKDGTNFLEKGGMKAVDPVFKNGAVLVMSLWDDHYANMLWLDSTYPVDGTCNQPGCAEVLVPSPVVCQLMLKRIWQMLLLSSPTSNMATLVPLCR